MMHLITIIPNSQHKQISKPYHVTTSIMKMVRTRIRKTVPLPMLVPAIASTFFLIWLIFGVFKYVSLEHRTRDRFTRKVELATVFGGLALLILGLTLMADLALGLTERLQQPDDIHDDNNGLTRKAEIEASKETKATCRIIRTIIRMFGTAIAMSMLIWIIYTGFRLATEPSIDSKYKHLVFAIGVISIAFGVIYFIIGLAIARELALDLLNRFRMRRNGNWNSRNQQLC